MSKTEDEDGELDPVLILLILEEVDEELDKFDKDVNSIVGQAYRRAYNSQVTRAIENIKELGIKMPQPINLNYGDFIPRGTLTNALAPTLEQIKVGISQAFSSKTWASVREIVGTMADKMKATYSVVNRVLRTFRTNVTWLRNAIMIFVQDALQVMGIMVKRVWVHTLISGRGLPHSRYKPRRDHMHMDGQIEDDQGYFHNGQLTARAPCMFGIASQDINCRCVVDFVLE